MCSLLLRCYCFWDFRGSRARKLVSVVYFSICKSRPNTPQLRLEPSSCFSSLNQITNPQLPPLQIFLLAASAPLTRSLPGLLAGLPMRCCSEPLHWLFPLPGMLFPQTLVGFLPPLIKIITLLQHPDLREAVPSPTSLSVYPAFCFFAVLTTSRHCILF